MKTAPAAQQPELLAPAGSVEAFFAAVEAGADAIYVGLKEFSARAKAKNFSLSDIERMTWLLQAQDKRLYITLNTLLKEEELPRLIDLLAALDKIGVDALILQDLGVWRLARQHFPALELHASTQLTIHNSAGIKMLEEMGFQRAVLARELTLDEIATIRRQTNLELEHFIHGALCFSFSGQCYFSSFLGGNSGNRGRCTQPCRRLHRQRQQAGYFFSPNDLSAIDLLPDLAQAGICSFKIEGRMKSAEYVHQVVGAYRRVLDAAEEDRPATVRAAKQQLKQSFGRQPTQGFLAGRQPENIATPAHKGATGRYLGKIDQVRDGAISFISKDSLHLGDRIRIQPASDQSGTAFTIRQLYLGQQPTSKTPVDAQVRITSSFSHFKPGDEVFLVSASGAFDLSEKAGRRRLSQISPPARPVDLEVHVGTSQLAINACCADQQIRVDFAIDSFPAERRPLSREVLQQAFGATGGTPFRLRKLQCNQLPPIVIPPKQLKQIRRDLYSRLEQQLPPDSAATTVEQRQRALDSLFKDGPPDLDARRELRVRVEHARDCRILQDRTLTSVLVPLNTPNLKQLNRLQRYHRELIWDVPFILFDADWQELQSAIHQAYEAGFRRFRLNNLGHFPLFAGLEGLTLISGFRLFALNSQAIAALADLGSSEAELVIEDDRDNLATILARQLPIPAVLTVYTSVPLLISRIQIEQLRGDSPVVSDRGETYRVERQQGLTLLRSERAFSLLGSMNELERSGCHRFIVDLSHLDPFGATGKEVLAAAKRGQDPEGSDSFNYRQGLT